MKFLFDFPVPENLGSMLKLSVSFDPDFLHFGQFYFYSRQVFNKRLANWTAITDA